MKKIFVKTSQFFKSTQKLRSEDHFSGTPIGGNRKRRRISTVLK